MSSEDLGMSGRFGFAPGSDLRSYYLLHTLLAAIVGMAVYIVLSGFDYRTSTGRAGTIVMFISILLTCNPRSDERWSSGR